MGVPKSMIDKFPPHIQKQIRSQFASKTRMEEIDSLQASLRMHTLTKYANGQTNRPLKIKGLKGIADMLGK